MPNPVVHAEVIGSDPARLRTFYRDLFGWNADPGDPVAASVSGPDEYAFTEPGPDSAAVPVGVGGGQGFTPLVLFYVGVDDVPGYLARAVELGGSVVVEPSLRPDGTARVARFADPEGNVVGLASPA